MDQLHIGASADRAQDRTVQQVADERSHNGDQPAFDRAGGWMTPPVDLGADFSQRMREKLWS